MGCCLYLYSYPRPRKGQARPARGFSACRSLASIPGLGITRSGHVAASQATPLCPAVGRPAHWGHSQAVPEILWLLLHRLGFQHGHPLPLPQLESVCHRLRAALRRVHGGSEVYAREPTVSAGGESAPRPPVRAMGRWQ